jgi:hypothetical protein
MKTCPTGKAFLWEASGNKTLWKNRAESTVDYFTFQLQYCELLQHVQTFIKIWLGQPTAVQSPNKHEQNNKNRLQTSSVSNEYEVFTTVQSYSYELDHRNCSYELFYLITEKRRCKVTTKTLY